MIQYGTLVLRRVGWVVRRFPATLTITALVLIVARLTSGSSIEHHRILIDNVGLDLGKVLNWQLWTLPASTVIQASPGIGIKLLLLIVVALTALEYIVGTWRAAITFFLSDWISAPLTILVAWPMAHLGLDRAYNVLYRPDTGSSAAAAGALAAAFVFLPRRWRLASLTVLFSVLVCLLPTPDLSANIAHILGAITGLAFGFFWRWKLPDRHRTLEWFVGLLGPERTDNRPRQVANQPTHHASSRAGHHD